MIIGVVITVIGGLALIPLTDFIFPSNNPDITIIVPSPTPSLKLDPLSPLQFSEINCRSNLPIGSPLFPCGSISTTVHNEGTGAAVNCVLSVEIIDTNALSAPGSTPSNQEKTSEQFNLELQASKEFHLFVVYHDGPGKYNLVGKVQCDNNTSSNESDSIININ